MARTAQQKLQAFRRQRGTPTRVSATDKLRKYRGLQKEEDDDESFVDQIGDLGKRIWYGETEDPWLGRTDEEGVEKAPFMGEVRGKMGVEDIPSYAAQLFSTETPGVLARLGYGLTKMGPVPSSDPNVLLAQQATKEGLESTAGVFRNPLAEDYFPVEGILNLASGLSPAAKALKLPKIAKAAGIVADPVSPTIGLGAKAVKKGVEKARPAVAPVVKKATEAVKKPLKGVSQFAKAVKIPGRNLQMEFTQAAQSFFTNMEPEFVDRMHQYATDSNLSQRMHDARLSPKPTMKKVQAKIKAYVDSRQEAASESFKQAKEAAIGEHGALGVSTDIDGALPITINDNLNEFGGRLKIRWKEKIRKPDPKNPQKMVEEEVERSAMMDKEGGLYDENGRLVDAVPADVFEWDVEWLRKEATMGDKANNKVRKHLREMLNSGEVVDGRRSLTVQQGLTYVEKNNAVIAAMKRGQRPAAKLTSKLRDVELAAIDDVMPPNARGYMKEYRRHKQMLDQLEEDFGVKPNMDDISRKKLNKKLQDAFRGDEGTDNVTRLETVIGKEGVADIIGSAHYGAFAGGLVVRSEFSNITKLLASIPVIAYGASSAGLGPLAAAAGGLLGGIGLGVLISPRAQLEVARYLGRHPKWRKAITGRGDVKIQPEALQALITNVRQMAQKLKAANIDVKTLAAQGMTLGQLMQRLEPE